MLAAIRSAAVLGVQAYDVTVEVDVALGLPQWTIVGLAASSVKESRQRVCAALLNAGFALPPRRVTVNLAPADVKKEGTAFDLPIALAYLAGTGQLHGLQIENVVALGELGLDGSLRAVRGVLPVAARMSRLRVPMHLVVPAPNADEASLVDNVRIMAPSSLAELVSALKGGQLSGPQKRERPAMAAETDADFADVVGQSTAKRALEIAAAGGHNALLVGPPGAGKTMLARRLPGILPALTPRETLEVLAIHSVAGALPRAIGFPVSRPFRAPHHSVSSAGLIGGGSIPRPGEASLAHHGVLFLDELLEFPRNVLDALRQPLEDGSVTLARAQAAIEFPARFTLVGAMNPCPCGKAGDPALSCTCAAAEVLRYRSRLSGPLADRIDVHVTVGALPLRLLHHAERGETSAKIRERVEAARERQRARYHTLPGVSCNAQVPGRWLDSHGKASSEAKALLAAGSERLGLSARGYHRVLKVARTVADLDGVDHLGATAIAEALRFRPALNADPAAESASSPAAATG